VPHVLPTQRNTQADGGIERRPRDADTRRPELGRRSGKGAAERNGQYPPRSRLWRSNGHCRQRLEGRPGARDRLPGPSPGSPCRRRCRRGRQRARDRAPCQQPLFVHRRRRTFGPHAAPAGDGRLLGLERVFYRVICHLPCAACHVGRLPAKPAGLPPLTRTTTTTQADIDLAATALIDGIGTLRSL